MSNTKKLTKLIKKYKTKKDKPTKHYQSDDYEDLLPYIELANNQDRQSDMGGSSRYYWR